MSRRSDDENRKPHAETTRLSHLGRDSAHFHGAVNVPVYRASTILHPSLDSFEGRDSRTGGVVYGRYGTPSSQALEELLADLDGAAGCVTVSSGLAAISGALLALAKAGDHILVTDSAYYPTRKLCEKLLSRYGVETEFYDPLIGEGIAALIRPETSLIYAEAPGSLTFEMQDLPALGKAARAAGIPLVCDNTWATPLYCKPLALGADVVIQAGTKYIVGHSDAMLGAITATQEYIDRIREAVRIQGVCAGSEEIYLGLRGLRTLAVRLPRHQETGLALARWLQGRPEVGRVMHPGLPDDPGHAIWKRDFTGACGLFGFVLAEQPARESLAAFVEGLELFGLGASWGGYESLVLTAYPERIRSATAWAEPSPVIRLHAGLEDPDDLITDLEAGFARLCGRT